MAAILSRLQCVKARWYSNNNNNKKTQKRLTYFSGRTACWWTSGHICLSEQSHFWIRQRLVTRSAPSHYLNQCWLIVVWILRNKGQWKLNRNRIRFTQENNSKMSSVNWRSFSLDFNVLNHTIPCQHCNQPPKNGSTNHVFLIMWSLKTPPDIKKLFRSMIYAVTVYIYFAGLQLPWVIFIQGELNFRICLNSLMPSDAYMRQ